MRAVKKQMQLVASESPLLCFSGLFFNSISLPRRETQDMKHQEIYQTSLFPLLPLSLSHHLQQPAVPVPGAHKPLESPLS